MRAQIEIYGERFMQVVFWPLNSSCVYEVSSFDFSV